GPVGAQGQDRARGRKERRARPSATCLGGARQDLSGFEGRSCRQADQVAAGGEQVSVGACGRDKLVGLEHFPFESNAEVESLPLARPFAFAGTNGRDRRATLPWRAYGLGNRLDDVNKTTHDWRRGGLVSIDNGDWPGPNQLLYGKRLHLGRQSL